ncbi:MAG: FoF1 ATP synthase subunit gamma [Candidatus Omnitrophota bacterium]
MIPVAKIKKDLQYSQNLKEVIDILKLISSSEFSRLTNIAPGENELEKYVVASLGMIQRTGTENKFFMEREDLPRGYVLVCSDEGFLGEMNNRVINQTLLHGAGKKKRFTVLGERGAEQLEGIDLEKTVFPAINSEIDDGDILKLTNHIFDQYKKNEVGSVYVVYMHFHSFTSHKTETVRLLPCNELIGHLGAQTEIGDVIVKPDADGVIDYIVKMWIKSKVQDVFWSSKLSEWAIRIMRLESSSDELKEITENLRFNYFKSVHALSDKVIREIFAAKAIRL